MRKWTRGEKRLWAQGVALLVLFMVAVAMLSEVSRQDWGLTPAYGSTERQTEAYAESVLETMTTEEMVAQLLLVKGADTEELAVYGYGGVFTDEDFFAERTPQEAAEHIAQMQAAAKIPLLIGAEEEGGAVNTVSRFPQFRGVPFLSPTELLTTGGLPLAATEAADKCVFLKNLGINLNFAPLCHVTTCSDGAMYPRAMHGDGAHTARYVAVIVEEMEQQRIIAVLKDFPGYGNLTEGELPLDGRGIGAFRGEDYLPFSEGIEAGASAVLMGHSVMTAIDPQNPAALSKAVHRQLRKELDFDGVIITDCLTEDPWELYPEGDALAVAAVEAGNDLLVTDRGAEVFAALLEAVERGRISEKRLEESVLRILKLKIEYGIISQ